MKFVIDENVSYGLAEALRTSGHQVTAISGGMKDMSLFDMVGKETVLITRDHHFTNPLRFAPEKIGGIIYIRPGSLKSKEEIEIVMGFLEMHSFSQFEKRLVTLYRNLVKIREGMADSNLE